jgi:hydrogenase maturation protease
MNCHARVLIGGVGHRWQRDASFGVVACDELARMDWPEGVEVADLGYGALYAAQDIGDAVPPYERLVLLAAMPRGRDRGRIYSYRYQCELPPADEIQERVREAGAGVIDLDHLLVIAAHLRVLPPEVIVIELEPVDMSPGIELTPEGAACVSEAIRLVREAVQ